MGVGWWGRNGDIAQEAVSDRLRVLQASLCCTNQNIELGLLEHLKGGRAVIVLEHGLVVVSDGKLGQKIGRASCRERVLTWKALLVPGWPIS